MEDNTGDNGDQPQRVEIDKSPSPEDEAKVFASSDDEQRLSNKRAHDLAVMDREMGWLGKLTGTAGLPFKAAVLIEIGLFLALFWSLAFESGNGASDKLITAIMTVAGFIFGERMSRSRGD